jgi:hypothetical protein
VLLPFQKGRDKKEKDREQSWQKKASCVVDVEQGKMLKILEKLIEFHTFMF